MEFSFKRFIVLTASLAIVAGCQLEKMQADTDPLDGQQYQAAVRTFTVFSESHQPQDNTKTFLGGSSSDATRSVLWNKGDCLYVTDGSSGNKFTVTSESGSTKAEIEGSIARSKWYSSVYPYCIVSSYGKDGFSVNLPSVQTYYPDGVSPDSYPMVALCDNGMFRFKNVCGVFAIQLKGDGGKVSSISFSGKTSDGKNIPVAGSATLALQSGSAPTLTFADGASTSVALNCSGISSLPTLSSTPTTFHIVLPYGTYDSISLSIFLTDGRRMTVNSGRPLTIHRSGFTLAGSLTFKEDAPDVPEAVDLGLSVKWASCNLGASKPEEYGGYYHWAGLEDVSSTSIYLDKNNCPYHSGSSYSTGWTKYVPSGYSSYWSGGGSPDNKTVLDPEDDIAHVTLGGKWRMPTLDEWTELKNNCTWTWTTQNGVNGYKVTSKKSGYTGKSIFLPAAGYRYDDNLYVAGSFGYYWSSSLNTDWPSNAYELYFRSDYVRTSSGGRYSGRSVRPVYGDKVSVTGVSLSKTSLDLNIGETYTLSATVIPSNAPDKSVSWSSSNEGVATVDQSGKVTAVKAGTATITVTTTDGGYTATCSVTVKETEPYFVIDGQSNYFVDAGGGEFQFIVKSNVEWILKDYHDSSYPWQKTTISKNGNEATVKVIIEANTEYSSRESYIKFTVPSIQDPILDENGQATGETTDHIEKVYFKQSGLANVAWETVLPSGTKRENQLSIAKGSSTYLLCDGNSFYSFNQKTGAVTTATIPSIGEEIVEITNDDAGNLLLATSTEFGKTFDIYAIPAGTSIGANTNPSLIIHSNSDINGVGPGHITARGNVFEEGIITALVTCWDSAFGAYWEIEKGKATAQPRYVTINIQNLWSPLSAAFSPLGISASSGFIYNGYDGMYNYVYIDKNGSSKKIGSRGDWDAGVNCIVPSFWGNEPIVVANVMSYFPEQYPSYIEIYKLNSMDPVASIQIKTSNGFNNTGRSSCIMLENENGNLIIYCADGSQNVLSKITIPSKISSIVSVDTGGGNRYFGRPIRPVSE